MKESLELKGVLDRMAERNERDFLNTMRERENNRIIIVPAPQDRSECVRSICAHESVLPQEDFKVVLCGSERLAACAVFAPSTIDPGRCVECAHWWVCHAQAQAND